MTAIITVKIATTATTPSIASRAFGRSIATTMPFAVAAITTIAIIASPAYATSMLLLSLMLILLLQLLLMLIMMVALLLVQVLVVLVMWLSKDIVAAFVLKAVRSAISHLIRSRQVFTGQVTTTITTTTSIHGRALDGHHDVGRHLVIDA
jgi:hypothetical protein